MGSSMAFSSPATAALGSNKNETDCPLLEDEPLNITQISWFSSIFSIGAVSSIFLGGLSINWIGRRGTIIISALPHTLGWGLIGFSSNYAMLITGRLICGIAVGIKGIAINTYIGEIASSDIRGFLGTGMQMMINVGVLYVYSFGVILCWQWLALACLVPVIASSSTMFFNMESPTYLLSKGRVEEARQALVHFRASAQVIVRDENRTETSRASMVDDPATPIPIQSTLLESKARHAALHCPRAEGHLDDGTLTKLDCNGPNADNNARH
ncbi:Major facilitator sugar transporter-like [Trinorchestia longiramus]|nr:Major facilitator sugar transporter-like [Trinorchestia longiramus]